MDQSLSTSIGTGSPNVSKKKIQIHIGKSDTSKSESPDLSFSSDAGKKRLQINAGKANSSRRRFGKINTSQRAVCCSKQYVVEHFGPQMPIAVTESLMYTPGAKTNATVNINAESGWGWYVCGRKLLVWPVVPSKEKIPPTVLSRELILPSSDLAHSANLVVVYVEAGNQAASCMAVSPEGTVRYWQTIGQHNSWFDVNPHLGGEEVCAVRYVPPLGCLAVTTSGSMILLTTTLVKGMPSVKTTHVSVPQGWFNTIGRRMSSVIFGFMPPSQVLESKIVKVLTRRKRDSSWHIFLMSGLSLQSWNISKDQNHNMYFDCDLTNMVKDSFQMPLKEDSEIALLDMRYSDTGLMFLAVCSRPRKYIIVELFLENEKTAPTQAAKYCELSDRDISVVEGTTDKVATNLQFLPLTSSALVFNNNTILGIQFGRGNEDEEEWDSDVLDIPGGFVLGGNMYQDVTVFFSVTYGFVSVSPVDSSCLDVINSSTVGNTSVSRSSFFFESEEKPASKMDSVSAIKTAFIHYIRKNMVQCKAVISKEFPSTNALDIDSQLATTLVKVSLDITNDAPSKDPRWGESKSLSDMPGANSLHLENQLLEKQQAHDLFILFVKDLSLTETLGKVNRKGYPNPVKTLQVLYEHNEKIAGVIALKRIHHKFQSLIDRAIKSTCDEHHLVPSQDISYTDYFYRHISMIDDGIRNLTEYCVKIPSFEIFELRRFADVVTDTNSIIVEVLQAIIKKQDARGPQNFDTSCLPWLTASGNKGLFDYLMRQMHTSYSLITDHNYGVSKPGEFIDQMFLLVDVILYSQKDSSDSQKFEDLRSSLIRPFVMLKEYEKAVQLGEKYKDFEILIEICYEETYIPRLIKYMTRFEDEGFCESMFDWFIKENKRNELINLHIPPQFNERLSKFLEKYPSIGWIHTSRMHDINKSASMLTKYGMRSNAKYAVKVERAIALAKMAAVAEGKSEKDLSEINGKLQVLIMQKKLNENVLARFGFSKKNIRPLDASELIQLFISEENTEATEKDFKRSLDLLPYVDPEQAEQLRIEIWAKAVLRDSWTDLDMSSPLETICKLTVFRLMERIILKDNDPETIIPTVDEIVSHEDLATLNSNKLFRYVLQYGYEHYLEPGGFDKKSTKLQEEEHVNKFLVEQMYY